MDDYFKNKLANFKSKSKLLLSRNESDDNAEYAFNGFSTNTHESDENETPTHQGFGFSFDSGFNRIKTPETVGETKKIKKKKKNKFNDLEECDKTVPMISDNVNDIASIEQTAIAMENDTKVKKKSKKKKACDEDHNEASEETISKKKKHKSTESYANNVNQESGLVEKDNHVLKRKKKRKNKVSEE